MNVRPAIGITCAREPIDHGASWHQSADFVPTNYVAAVQRAGGRALLLPADPADAADPSGLLDDLDGLLLTGGVDLDPATYGAERHPETVGDTPERDHFEVALAAAAQQRDLPLLAICRGMQIVNAAAGGTLLQHLPDVLDSDLHRKVPGTLDERNAHDVRLQPGSLAARACGAERASVRSHHHQALDRIAAGWTVTGRATDDELTEAIERPELRFCLAVQWHPEADGRSTVIAALVDAARAGATPTTPPVAGTPTHEETR